MNDSEQKGKNREYSYQQIRCPSEVLSQFTLGEGTEPAGKGADIGVVDVPHNGIGHLVSLQPPPHRVCKALLSSATNTPGVLYLNGDDNFLYDPTVQSQGPLPSQMC